MSIQIPVRKLTRMATFAGGLTLALLSGQATPEDIDLFASPPPDLSANKPNVLIVLDNSSNWSRQSQQWPGGLTQGQAEAKAIKEVINELPDNAVNIGLLEHITEGSGGDRDSAFVRYHLRTMNAANKTAIGAELDQIFNNINDPIEKRNSGNPFGKLFWDLYNYLGGLDHSNGGAGTPTSLVDAAGYSLNYSKFQSPLSALDECSRTIVIFLGNNVSSGPSDDDQATIDALGLAGGNLTQAKFADFDVTTTMETADLGYSPGCFASSEDCTADFNTSCTAQGFDNCYCDSSDSASCNQAVYGVTGLNFPAPTEPFPPSTTTSAGQYTGDPQLGCTKAQDLPVYSCPASMSQSTVEDDTPNVDFTRTTTTTTSWSSCAYASIGATGCNGGRENWEPRGTREETVTVTDRGPPTETALGSTSMCYDNANSCSTADYPDCSNPAVYDACVCDSPNPSTCGASTNSSYRRFGDFTKAEATPNGQFVDPPGGPWIMDEWARFLHNTGVPIPGTSPAIQAKVDTYTIDVFNAQQNGNFSALLFNAARLGGGRYFQARNESDIKSALRDILDEAQSVNSAFASASLPVSATNRAQNANQVFIGTFKPTENRNPRWFGNLKKYQLMFTGPVVELGDSQSPPKQAIDNQTGFISDCAVSFWTTDTGDYWSDVSTVTDARGRCSNAIAAGADPYSDSPDGPFVEKGGAAQVIRLGNTSGDATVVTRNMLTLSGGSIVDFNTTNVSLPFPETLNTTSIVNYIRGMDNGLLTPDADQDGSTTDPRPSIHGDVVHSRPQPVNFGASGDDVVVYYGANDGSYRAVQASDGKELWSFVAPDHYSRLGRLWRDSPRVRLFGNNPLTSDPKDYFFDGSTGVFQNADSSEVLIFPTMRRGGRRIYAFDVTGKTTNPTLEWRGGCNPSGVSCAADPGVTTPTPNRWSHIGQTWSRPNIAFIWGHTDPFVIMGGGYDECEDVDLKAPPCGAPKGRGVYVINARTGAIERFFDFSGIAGSRSVAADVSLIDINQDGFVDYAYAADTGGSIYRMNFIADPDVPRPVMTLSGAGWGQARIARTQASSGRKFLFTPALFVNDKTVYLAIGSGDREHPLEQQYPYRENVLNRFYVFKDSLYDTTQLDLDNTSGTGQMSDYSVDNGCASPDILPGSTGKQGWLINLDDYGRGEQTVTSAAISGGFVVFSTNRPTPAALASCSNSLGEARGYFMRLLNGSGAIGVDGACGGSRSDNFVGGGLPPSPVLATVRVNDGDNDPTNDPIKTIVIGAVQKDGGASTIISPQKIEPPIAPIRRPVDWRNETDSD